MENAEAINAFIDDVEDKKFTQAKGKFDDLVADKLRDALDQQKIRIASEIYGYTGDEVEDSSDEDEYEEVEDSFDEDEYEENGDDEE